MDELIILAAFAHPDDETILAGGTLAMLVDRGAKLHLLLATRGEGGELGEPPLTNRTGLGPTREQELRCAAKYMGIDSVLFLDYIDPVVGEDQNLHPFEADLETLADEIGTALQATQARVLISHGSNGEYGHPAHTFMHRACLLGLQTTLGAKAALYTIAANFPDHPRPRLANQDDPAHFVLNIKPWLPAKLKAAECHQTQRALFVRRASQEAGRPRSIEEVLMTVESLHRAWPPWATGVGDPLSQFLRTHCSDAILLDVLNQASSARDSDG